MNTPNKLRSKIKELIIEKYGYACCTGCLKHIKTDSSHLCKKIHLTDVSKYQTIENLTEHCNQCHIKWESDQYKIMSTLKDFEENMQRIKQLNELRYNRLINKF